MDLYINWLLNIKIVWITSNVLTVTALVEDDMELRRGIVDKALECIDEFGNKIECNWNLLKVNEEWKIDMIDVSASEI